MSIQITFPDGNVKSFDAPVTGLDIAQGISPGLAKKAVVVNVNGELWDLTRPIDGDAKISIITRNQPEAAEVIRHDAAHVMAQAVQELYPGTQITFGPATEYGFYYDFARAEPFTEEDLAKIEQRMRDIVKRDSLRNAIIVAMAIGGSTNVVLHVPEIARAAGYEHFWRDVMTPEEFNHLSQHVVPVLTNARPYGKYSMLDIDRVGGVQVIVKELLDAGLLNGDMMTCTGRTLAEQVADLNATAPDGDVIHSVAEPFKPTGGLRMLGGNLSPDFSAILKLAGVEGGLEDNLFKGRARVFEREAGLIQALDEAPDSFQDHDMVIVRYDGPSGGPGMPEMLDPTSRITTLCRERGIVIALMTDARFSGGSVGLVIGHVGPEAALGGPIAFVHDGDEIIVDLNTNTLNCPALDDAATLAARKAAWDKAVADNGGIHPNCGIADTRLLHRARHTAVPAVRGGGLHPNREVWVRDPRPAEKSGFEPRNRHRSA